MLDLTNVDEAVQHAIEHGVFPGACYAVHFKDELAIRTHGRHMYCPESPEITRQTLWDMASCTKVVACTSAAMILVDDGRLKLDQYVVEVIPEFAAAGKESITVRNLLLHNTGLPGGINVHRGEPGWNNARVLHAIYTTPLKKPIGSETIYSDLNAVVLGKMIERITGQSLDSFVREKVFSRAGMGSTMYRPGMSDRPRCAPTEAIEPWRYKARQQRGLNFGLPGGERCHPDSDIYIQGDVHDPTAFMIGGVSGNAGLFSTIEDLCKFASLMLNSHRGADSGIFWPQTVQQWTTCQNSPKGSSRALGWDTKSPKNSSAGHYFSPTSFGHTGYTGTSIWIDPDHDLFAILLTNRVHPLADTGDHTRIGKFRPLFHDTVAEACGIA